MSGETIAIGASDLHKRFWLGKREVYALRGVSLTVPQGAFCTIIGPSGSGKSTLLNVMGLLDTPDSGEVLLNGTSLIGISSRDAAAVRRRHIGFVFQDFNLIPVLSVYENVTLPLRAHTRSDLAARSSIGTQDRVRHLIESVGLLDWVDHKPTELSGGQQQRVAIARALANSPSVVLADEPTANLDSETGKEILALMQRTSTEFGTTFVLSTHDSAVTRLATMTIELRDGAVYHS